MNGPVPAALRGIPPAPRVSDASITAGEKAPSPTGIREILTLQHSQNVEKLIKLLSAREAHSAEEGEVQLRAQYVFFLRNSHLIWTKSPRKPGCGIAGTVASRFQPETARRGHRGQLQRDAAALRGAGPPLAAPRRARHRGTDQTCRDCSVYGTGFAIHLTQGFELLDCFSLLCLPRQEILWDVYRQGAAPSGLCQVT